MWRNTFVSPVLQFIETMSQNLQPENGHVDLAYGIVDAMCKTKMSNYEARVLWAIWRKTYGWKKTEDWISLSQFREMTGISTDHVSRTLSILEQRGIIIRSERGGLPIGATLVRFNKYTSQWRGLPKGATAHGGVAPIGRRGVAPIGNGGLPKGASTKDNVTNDGTLTNSEISLEILSSETTAAPAGASPSDVTPAGHHVESSPAVAAAVGRMLDLFEQISGRKVRIRNKTRTGQMRMRLKDFTETDLEMAWRMMAKDSSLRGDNKTGVDYFTIEYAMRVQYIERYLDRAKASGAVKDPATGKIEKAPRPSLPPVRITRPDGSVVEEHPDGRCVVISPAPSKKPV
jgi:phage replication O-like protein O